MWRVTCIPALNKEDSAIAKGWEIQNSRVTTHNTQNAQFSTKIYKICKETGKHGPSQGIQKLTKTISEEVQTLELQVKDIKSTVLGMFNDVEETMDKKTKGNKENGL